ncbi:MAG: hypothetical protein HOP19_14505 [Acidobacteria bacterium]|nr:hypothetical protein [Acidobacteriota bacterium]
MAENYENLARRYLLGQLTETKQEAFEAQYFTDAERLEEVREAETRLVDDYVRERLNRADRAQFERYYLDYPPHRERVALARHLLKAADAQAIEPARTNSLWADFLEWFRTPQLVWGAALAALLLIVFFGLKARREREQWNAHVPAVTPSPLQSKSEDRLAAASPSIAPSPLPSATQPAQAPSVFAFTLSAGLLRGNAKPQLLALPHGVSQIELRIPLEAGDYAQYKVRLRTVEGQAVWSRNRLKPRPHQLVVTVPAQKLPADDYLLTLSGLSDGAVEEVNRFFFRVSR